MGARKGAARVGACLVPLVSNLFVGPFSPSCGEGGGFFHIEVFFWVPFPLCAGGGAFSHYVQNFFGAHALVARVIANMLLWKNLRQIVIHNLLISVNTFWSTFE